jgi:hypothetical protein
MIIRGVVLRFVAASGFSIGWLATVCSPSLAQHHSHAPAFNTQAPASQLRPAPVRNYGGWTRSQPNASSPLQRSSNYQQLSDLPNLQNFGDGFSSQPQSLPSDPTALMNSLSDLPTNSLRQTDPRSLTDLRGAALANEQFDAQQYDRGMIPFDPRANPQDINGMDPRLQNNPVSQAAFQSGPDSVYPPQQQQFQQPPYQQPQYQQQPYQQQGDPRQPNMQNQPYPFQPTMGATSQTRQIPVTTGLPHVTPPVAPNQRYATSPYMGRPMFMNAAYQRTSTVNYPNQMQGNESMVLPQNIAPRQQPVFTNTTPGVYPTAYQQCAPSLPPDGAVGPYAPPTVTPNWNPNMYSSNNSGYRPLISLGQENYNVVLGRGLFGQPTVYVPGQYVRNFLRYIFP